MTLKALTMKIYAYVLVGSLQNIFIGSNCIINNLSNVNINKTENKYSPLD